MRDRKSTKSGKRKKWEESPQNFDKETHIKLIFNDWWGKNRNQKWVKQKMRQRRCKEEKGRNDADGAEGKYKEEGEGGWYKLEEVEVEEGRVKEEEAASTGPNFEIAKQ